MISRQLNLFFTAWQFLTRLPSPVLHRFQPEDTVRSARYFPLVGQAVGAISATVLLAASLVLPPLVATILALVAGIIATGAFHEDGLADTADGLGGGQTRERRLEIMKDSRVGTYGAVALIAVFSLKAACLSTLSAPVAAMALIAGHGLARAAAVIAMRWMPYAGQVDLAKGQIGQARVRLWEMTLAISLSLWPLVFGVPQVALGIILGGGLGLILALIARRLIGGQTGDVLGGIEQLFEVGFLLGVAATAPIFLTS